MRLDRGMENALLKEQHDIAWAEAAKRASRIRWPVIDRNAVNFIHC
jgi:hypothetical protein